jgi:hypothetical protein
MTNTSVSDVSVSAEMSQGHSGAGDSRLHLLMRPERFTQMAGCLDSEDRLVLLNEAVLLLGQPESQRLLVEKARSVTGASRIGVVSAHSTLFGTEVPGALVPLSMEDVVDWVECCESSVTWS